MRSPVNTARSSEIRKLRWSALWPGVWSAVRLRLPARTTSPSPSSGYRRTEAWCGAANRSASGRWSGCECVTRTTPTVLPASRWFSTARCESSSGPGSMTATTGPASTIHVFVPGPVYGPGLGATTRVTAATFWSAGAIGGEVDVRSVGPACVQPAVELGVNDEPDQRLAKLGHRQGLPLAGGGHLHLPPAAHGLGGNAERVAHQPVAEPREGLHHQRLRAENGRVGRKVVGRGRHGEVEDGPEHNAPRAVLRLDRGHLEPGRSPAHLLSLLEESLHELGPPERHLPGRLLQGEHRRAQLVAQPAEQVFALLVDQALAKLGALARRPEAAALGPTHQPAIEEQRLPRPARRGELGVGGAVPPVIGDGLEAAADSDPHRRDGAVHINRNGVGVRGWRLTPHLRRPSSPSASLRPLLLAHASTDALAPVLDRAQHLGRLCAESVGAIAIPGLSGANPGRHRESERGPAPVARRHPDPAAERALDDQAA